MTEHNEPMRQAAQEMTNPDEKNHLRHDIITEGLYHAVVEGGHHQQTLSDEEVDHLCELFLEGGINRVKEYGTGE